MAFASSNHIDAGTWHALGMNTGDRVGQITVHAAARGNRAQPGDVADCEGQRAVSWRRAALRIWCADDDDDAEEADDLLPLRDDLLRQTPRTVGRLSNRTPQAKAERRHSPVERQLFRDESSHFGVSTKLTFTTDPLRDLVERLAGDAELSRGQMDPLPRSADFQ